MSNQIMTTKIIFMFIFRPFVFSLHGATMGTTALLSGYLMDALTVAIAAEFVKWKRQVGLYGFLELVEKG